MHFGEFASHVDVCRLARDVFGGDLRAKKLDFWAIVREEGCVMNKKTKKWRN